MSITLNVNMQPINGMITNKIIKAHPPHYSFYTVAISINKLIAAFHANKWIQNKSNESDLVDTFLGVFFLSSFFHGNS